VTPDAPARLTTALADRYQLERELGQGGMATVYLAHDLKHDRQVAIKVLRPELAAVIGAERFLSEIKTTANLQHPHILPLFDSGESEGFLFYVMPYVEGESLRSFITREKQLPVADAIRVAREVASALDYAHKRGVVHRDIKPENILLHDGSALVADFGIALAASKAGDRMTQTGMSLGTPSYMSPEQAMGEREIGPRSDVYALGAMTYEMLVGEPPFAGPTAQAIVAKVLTEEPASLIARRRTVPSAVENAVLTALQKLPADRYGSAKEFSDALDGSGPATTRVLPATRRAVGGARGRTLVLPALLLAVAALAAWGWLRPRPVAPAMLARYEVRLPYYIRQLLAYSGGSLAISADGGTIAYVGRNPEGIRQLLVRPRDAVDARPLAGTNEADAPFFSPDGKWIGYFVNGQLFKVAVAGGSPMMLSDSTNVNLPSGVWDHDGTIRFVGPHYDLRSVLETGGDVTQLFDVPKVGIVGYVFPAALPRNDAVLATACLNNCSVMTLVALDLRRHTQHELVKAAARGWYAPSGHLVFVRQDGGVFAQPFDARTLTLSGKPQPLGPNVSVGLGITPELVVSENGTMVHFDPSGNVSLRLVRMDRSGRQTVVDPGWLGALNYFRLSPDGRQLAISVNVVGRTEIWIKQLDQGPLTRFAFQGENVNYRPVWHPDGRSVGFISDRTGRSLPYVARADGSGPAERVEIADTAQVDEFEWSHDLQWIVYRTGTYAGVRRIALTAVPSKQGVEIEPGRFDSYAPTISPDGRWLAYVSTESGREQVYVRPFPRTGEARWQVSTAGGVSPVWAHSGRELFFADAAGRLVSVAIVAGASFQAGAPTVLFPLSRVVLSPFHQGFDVSPDDRTFYFLEDPSAADASGRFATLTLNALAGLDARPDGR